jgi:hypothetical protein
MATTVERMTGTATAVVRREKTRSRTRALSSVLVLAFLTSAVTAAVILYGLGGGRYYTTPLRVRGYEPAHRLLRPSGTVGRSLGIAGVVLMSAMQLYTVKKRKPRGGLPGSLPFWLEFHIFCGILGPVLITFHTSFKFNGIVSVAYWSMVLVVASGFVGRYLYVRIPKSIRGTELTLDELGEQSRELRQAVLEYHLPEALVRHIEDFEASELPAWAQKPTWRGLLFGEISLRLHFAALRRAARHAGIDREVLHAVLAVVRDRAVLLRRIAYLRRTKKLFDLWHVLHKPLAYLMLVIVVLHVATALYFGYAYGG